MTDWRDVLCLLAIFVAYGLTGHLDYQDAIAMEEAMREETQPPSFVPPGTTAEHAPLFFVDPMPVRRSAPASISAPACVPDHE